MAIPISQEQVMRAMRPHVGMRLLTSSTLARETADFLQSYAPYRQTLEELHDRLLAGLTDRLGVLTLQTMRVQLDEGERVLLTEERLDELADAVMGVLFESLTPFSANFVKLNDYSLHVRSLSVLRVLYTEYSAFFSDDEFAFLVRTIKRIYPPQRYSDWMRY